MSPAISVRNTLVLGIGTTGRKVAESVAGYLTWRFGDLSKAPWVRLLVLETSQEATMLGDRVIPLGMDASEFREYIDSPKTAGAEFGFNEWQDGGLLRAASPPTDGAGNLRMLGRLCLFHPKNYNLLQARVTREIGALKKLTNTEIQDILEERDVTVERDRNAVRIYVVGTLCGGTCSGGALDLGYLLHVWNNQQSVERQAIFTIPHPDYTAGSAARLKKNAFHAIKEFNHYQLADRLWKQKLPEHSEPREVLGKPYDIIRMMVPATSAPEDVDKLETMIGQYLATAAGYAGHVIAAADVNALGVIEGTEPIGYMRPLFSTMGIASLEVPGELIVSAINERLLDLTLEDWCSDTGAMPGPGDRDILGPLTLDAQLNLLVGDYKNREIDPFNQLFLPLRTDNVPNILVETIRERLTALNERLTIVTASNSLSAELKGKHTMLCGKIEPGVNTFVQRTLFRSEYGPASVARMLIAHQGERETWNRDASRIESDKQQQATGSHRMVLNSLTKLGDHQRRLEELRRELPGLEQDIQTAQTRAVRLRSDIERTEKEILRLTPLANKKIMGFGVGRQEDKDSLAAAQEALPALEEELSNLEVAISNTIEDVRTMKEEQSKLPSDLMKTWKETEKLLLTYLGLLIEAEAMKLINREQLFAEQLTLYNQAIERPVSRLKRLATVCGLKRGEYTRRWEAKAQREPRVNGKAFFEQRTRDKKGTVVETYEKCLRPPYEYTEPGAIQHIVDALSPFVQEIIRSDNMSWLDPQVGRNMGVPSLPTEWVSEIELRAKEVFHDAHLGLHLADHLENGAEDVKALIDDSEPALRVSPVQLSDQLQGVRGIRPQHQNIALMNTEQNGAEPAVVQSVQRILLNGLNPLQGNGIQNSRDPFRLLLIQERHGFTFGQMEGVVRRNSRDLNSLQSSDSSDFGFWHTRRDVEWVDPLTAPHKLDEAEELWLKTILLGHPKNSVLSWLPANAPSSGVPVKGWYRKTDQFEVYYVEGNAYRRESDILPDDFNTAVAKLMGPEMRVLRESLSLNFLKFCQDAKDPDLQTASTGMSQQGQQGVSALQQKERDVKETGYYYAVKTMERALDSLNTLGLKGTNKDRAAQILTRSYRRMTELTDAYYFLCKQEQDQGKGTFAKLWYSVGSKLPNGDRATDEGYYCPTCGKAQGLTIEELHERRFHCDNPTCNNGEQYWP